MVDEERPPEVLNEKLSQFLVHWDGPDDPENPKNWSKLKRWYVTVFGSLLVFNASFASSAPSGILPQLIVDWNMSTEIATLLIAIFVLGYCVGPIFWAPLSEAVGRRPIFIIAFTLYTIFQVACAVAPNTGALIAFRFLGGLCAACPLTNAGAILADMWDPDNRGRAIAFFALAPFAGPALGPIVSGYMTVAGVHWRWLFWVLTFFAAACTIGIVFTVPETFAPTLLTRKARALRKKTGDTRYFSALEVMEKNPRRLAYLIFGRPFKMLIREPMLFFITLYMSFVYGCIYLLFEAFPIVFTLGHHMDEGTSGLMFLPLFLGGCTGAASYLFLFNPRYEKHIERFAPKAVPPEYRLEMAFIGAPIFAIGFFWFGWTSFPSISFWSPMMATSLLGLGVVLIFLSLFNYIIDAYLMVAASALASSTIVRSLFGAAFPLFATQMYNRLNPRWASTLLGCLAVLMIPIPFVLRVWGARLRRKSKYAPTD
ncbi:MFS general substrate transporter [Dacryopinax primogenitus]|uniref:MFS general substrate transporter n=1 Tax=Dacryopinax primogenitus (strain DJM 731) TaxID=1858805 RepID=M5FY43_DACPD|nr:MFS general substrate transporter [Dacryopinax primogenitus]EJU01459.1 MFS general substrate transporter [Dacryopinax primogenitus]